MLGIGNWSRVGRYDIIRHYEKTRKEKPFFEYNTMNKNNGFIRIAAAVPVLRVADTAYNAARVIELIREAAQAGVHTVVFPECTLTGYTVNDLFHQDTLLQGALDGLKLICEETRGSETVAVVGLPIATDNQVFNCAAVLRGGRCLGIVPKTYIPGYNEYYEQRWFSPGTQLRSAEIVIHGERVPCGNDLLFGAEDIKGLVIGVEICEDLWVPCPPSSQQATAGATILLNLSASNELIAKAEYRRNLVSHQSGSCIAGYALASAGVHESTTDMVFSGHAIVAENGVVLKENQRFERGPTLTVADVDSERLIHDRQVNTSFRQAIGMRENGYRILDTVMRNTHWGIPLQRELTCHPFVPGNPNERDKRCEEILAIQTAGLEKRLEHCKIDQAVVGVSGGLDSTLALLVCVKAFDNLGYDRKCIHALTMPGFGTSSRTYQNVNALARALAVDMQEINITDACLKHFDDIGHNRDKQDIVYENVQARERTQILMNRANQCNGLLVGTGDLSEMALGWSTYNGDHMSMYNVNCGVPKTLVKYLIAWVADTQMTGAVTAVLHDILATPISPELLPADSAGTITQKTEETVGPYELHDFFLYHIVRFGSKPGKVLFLAEQAFKGKYTRAEIKQWLRCFITRFFANQFKRSCVPDGPKVGTVNLSPRGDWRMPSDAVPDTWLAELEAE